MPKKPASKEEAASESVAEQTMDYAEAVRLFQAEALKVWDDPAIWLAEAAMRSAPAGVFLKPKTERDRIYAQLWECELITVIGALRQRGDPMAPAWPPDGDDRRFQLVVRVIDRAALAGSAAVDQRYGRDRIFGKRKFLNAVREALADAAIRSGLPRDEAFEALGLRRRTAFNAAKRAAGGGK